MTASRRRLRWGRVFLLLAIMVVFAISITWGTMYAYKNYFAVPVAEFKTVLKEQSEAVPEKRINILLIGVDNGNDIEDSANADAMMLASINREDGSVNLLSIPRDTRVVLPGQKDYAKISRAFAAGGPALSVQAVEALLNLKVHYYAVINPQAFIKVVDILGGIDLYVETAMDYEDPYANLSIHLQKGFQHLSGEQAEQYVVFRNDDLGDIGRIQRQQRFVKACSDQLLQFKTLLKLPPLLISLHRYMNTNMKTIPLLKIIKSLRGYKTDGLYAEVLPGKFVTIGGVKYWIADKEMTVQIVDKLFNDESAK